MNESFLHFVWQFQYFDKDDLRCTLGDAISIFDPGYKNTHSGPDFYNAKLKLGSISWAGSVEIHIQSSGWREHRHHEDPAYENVVLHVVWNEDEIILRSDGTPLPTLVLQSRVSKDLLLRYKRIVHSRHKIPCAGRLEEVSSLVRLSMLDKAVVARLEKKAGIVLECLLRNNGDWEETTYQILCRTFGFNVNADPFLQLAQALPYKVVRKHGDRLDQIEALIFGQAGFLEEPVTDEYYTHLRREYRLLQKKYGLARSQMRRVQWRFLRMRPANFPTVRMAQLASLLFRQKNLFASAFGVRSLRDLQLVFAVRPSEYWLHHYRFFREQAKAAGSLGRSSIENILINTLAPLLAAYGKAHGDDSFTRQAVQLLQDTPAEDNNIIRSMKDIGWECQSAFDSQGLIELHNTFCSRRRCLDCNIGFSLLRPGAASPRV